MEMLVDALLADMEASVGGVEQFYPSQRMVLEAGDQAMQSY